MTSSEAFLSLISEGRETSSASTNTVVRICEILYVSFKVLNQLETVLESVSAFLSPGKCIASFNFLTLTIKTLERLLCIARQMMQGTNTALGTSSVSFLV